MGFKVFCCFGKQGQQFSPPALTWSSVGAWHVSRLPHFVGSGLCFYLGAKSAIADGPQQFACLLYL